MRQHDSLSTHIPFRVALSPMEAGESDNSRTDASAEAGPSSGAGMASTGAEGRPTAVLVRAGTPLYCDWPSCLVPQRIPRAQSHRSLALAAVYMAAADAKQSQGCRRFVRDGASRWVNKLQLRFGRRTSAPPSYSSPCRAGAQRARNLICVTGAALGNSARARYRPCFRSCTVTPRPAPLRAPPCPQVIGMAGTGKTSLVQRLNAHLHAQKRPPYLINLDPAVTKLPYGPNIDIRDTVNYKEARRGVRRTTHRSMHVTSHTWRRFRKLTDDSVHSARPSFLHR